MNVLFDILHHSILQLVYEIDSNGFAPVFNFYFMVMIIFFLSHTKHEHSYISSLLLFFPRSFYSWGIKQQQQQTLSPKFFGVNYGFSKDWLGSAMYILFFYFILSEIILSVTS